LVLTVVAALGLCAIAAAVMVPTLLGRLGAWPVLVAGLLMLIAALAALWVIQRRRDRTLW
jgi:MFS-type transporter involved in bile tolerance (Atg22 family)